MNIHEIFDRNAPQPSRRLDVPALVRAGARRRMRRRVAFVTGLAAAAGFAVFVGVSLSDVEGDRRPAPPVDSPSEDPTLEPFQTLKPGWNVMAPPPFERTDQVAVQTDAVTAWVGRTDSGRDLIVWGGYSSGEGRYQNGGYSWDASTGEWHEIAESPLAPRSGAGWAQVDDELLVWGGYNDDFPALDSGAAYNPETDSWRELPQAPLEPAVPICMVTIGDEVVVWGAHGRKEDSRSGAIYSVTEDAWRPMADAPRVIDQGHCEWTGSEVIVFGSDLDPGNRATTRNAVGIAYDPDNDSWRELPEVNLSPQASAIGWMRERLLAWDYVLGAAVYDPGTDGWTQVEDVPGNFMECYPTSTEVNDYVVAWYCGRGALWDTSDGRWRDMPDPPVDIPGHIPGQLVTMGEVLGFLAELPDEGSVFLIYVAPGGS